MKDMKKKGSSKTEKVIVSLAGIAGLTAAAVGAYYLYGHKEAAANRAKVKSWMLKAKGEVLEKLEEVEDVTEPVYMSAVAAVLKKYNELKNIDHEELADFMGEMKTHWSDIKKTVEKKGKHLEKKAKAVSKAARKAAEEVE